MAVIPGLDTEVFFQAPGKPERDWRQHQQESEPDDDDAQPLTEEEKETLVGLLGFDPAELWTEAAFAVDSATVMDAAGGVAQYSSATTDLFNADIGTAASQM